MKKLKQTIQQVKATPDDSPELNDLLWQLICYSPKMPVRLQQQQLLDEAENFTLTAYDHHFTHKNLQFNGFKWGSGSRRILITHGWGSKAADFSEMILALRELPDITVITFDAPGNGSSEGEWSNLALYVEATKAMMAGYGAPDVLIGHSLGAMANVLALTDTSIQPALLVSIASLIRLREKFEASMTDAEVSQRAQDAYMKSFEDLVGIAASYFDLEKLYRFDAQQAHLLLYDEADLVSKHDYLGPFLNIRSFIQRKNYPGSGHERIIKSPEVIADVVEAISKVLK